MIYDAFAEALIKANKLDDEWPILWGDRHSDASQKGDRWLECRWYPNGHETVTMGRHQSVDIGFFRVRVCARSKHARIKGLTRKAELIRLSFPATRQLGCAYIDSTPELSGLDTDDSEMMTYLTVTIRYTGLMLK